MKKTAGVIKADAMKILIKGNRCDLLFCPMLLSVNMIRKKWRDVRHSFIHSSQGCIVHDATEGRSCAWLPRRCRKMLTIARDRFGIKPLYISESDHAFAFGSMVASFRPWLPLSPEPLSIISYLLGHGGPSQGFTFYHNVKLLPAGGVVRIRQGERATYSRFFTMTDFWDSTEMDRLSSLSPRKAADLVEEQLYESVRKHLIADAPVGAFCSGGVDSSIIMAMASKLHNNLAIFHANIVGKWSEFDAASNCSSAEDS